MSVKTLVAGLFIAAAAGAAPAATHAATITFDGLSGTTSSYTESGVTFTSESGGLLEFTLTPNTTNGLLTVPNGSRPLTRADIGGGASFVSVDLGDFGADEDVLILQAFSADDVLLDSDTLTLPADVVAMLTLSVTAPDIAYVVMGGEGGAGSSVYVDNFTFRSLVASVPEPTTALLVALGTLVLARRRRA